MGLLLHKYPYSIPPDVSNRLHLNGTLDRGLDTQHAGVGEERDNADPRFIRYNKHINRYEE